MCSNLNYPNQNGVYGSPNQGCQLYNYPQGSNLGFAPQSSPPAPPGLDAIDQYLRSVLRPEAFLPTIQSQGPTNSSFWNSNIDPSLPQMNSAPPITYPWASGEILPPHIQPSHRQASQERNA
ncbi:hypothetical protein N7520_011299 [Penicillium odoratum]|uniref:uncharacterized protein n=1 Tax=Penicillium odoratum TaxID=1167516 RepID=UPI002546B7AF|nr:uncharacterized protein N7520_011299 [Penicillium odoratum]KAJ5746117.1 hypothetical protein N7520_011299 [Penicillium odoratum]